MREHNCHFNGRFGKRARDGHLLLCYRGQVAAVADLGDRRCEGPAPFGERRPSACLRAADSSRKSERDLLLPLTGPARAEPWRRRRRQLGRGNGDLLSGATV